MNISLYSEYLRIKIYHTIILIAIIRPLVTLPGGQKWMRMVSHGPLMGSIDVNDLPEPVALDTEAHLVSFPLREDVTLTSVKIEAIANDVIFGVMGATLLK